MKKQFFSLFFFLGASIYGMSQSTVTINGNVTTDCQELNKIYVIGLRSHLTAKKFSDVFDDSVIVKDQHFTISFPFTKPLTVLLVSQYGLEKTKSYTPYSYVFTSAGTLNLQDVDLSNGVTPKSVSGIQGTVDLFNLQHNIAPYQDGGPILKEFIKKYADDSLLSIRGILSGQKMLAQKQITPDDYAQAFNLLSAKVQNSPKGQEINKLIAGAKSGVTGQTIQNFSIPKSDGTILNIKDFRGKYVLIDFWASWCGPCKASFPFMKDIYQKYKSDKFEIVGISIDKDKAAWLKELENQQLPWIAGWDESGKNVSGPDFGVTGIPATFLIDPEGKIIEKETGMNNSENNPILQKLVSVFGK